MTGSPVDLDDPGTIARADPGGSLRAVEESPSQWVEAMRRARAIGDLPTHHGITGVVFCGMGGSGIAGDVLAAVAAERDGPPVAVVRGYRLPGWVGTKTLVFAASYSGDTEETLACFDDALKRQARVIALTTGGALGAEASARSIPTIAPVEGLRPRQAFVSLIVPTLVIAERMGIVPSLTDDLAEAEGLLNDRAQRYGRDVPVAENDAKRIALELEGLFPIIWGQEGMLAPAAARWRTQLNENAKVPASSSVLPEVDHNEIEGFDPGLPSLTGSAVVVLRAPGEHPRVSLRIEATLDVVRDRVGRVIEAWAAGTTGLARLVTAVTLGDAVSVYLAIRRGVDPSPVDVLEALKRRLT